MTFIDRRCCLREVPTTLAPPAWAALLKLGMRWPARRKADMHCLGGLCLPRLTMGGTCWRRRRPRRPSQRALCRSARRSRGAQRRHLRWPPLFRAPRLAWKTLKVKTVPGAVEVAVPSRLRGVVCRRPPKLDPDCRLRSSPLQPVRVPLSSARVLPSLRAAGVRPARRAEADQARRAAALRDRRAGAIPDQGAGAPPGRGAGVPPQPAAGVALDQPAGAAAGPALPAGTRPEILLPARREPASRPRRAGPPRRAGRAHRRGRGAEAERRGSRHPRGASGLGHPFAACGRILAPPTRRTGTTSKTLRSQKRRTRRMRRMRPRRASEARCAVRAHSRVSPRPLACTPPG